MASGGKQGRHTEHFGFLIAEMQILPRTYPGVTW
jgi:ring-1,2-phenylacetyl-CoA epoxidase subunit PaaC